jgi:type IV pilus assembly protein PilW
MIELIVSSLIASIVLVAALSLVAQQREAFLKNQRNTQISQNLRAAMDLIGTDIKQAGERLDSKPELPGISLVQGTDGPDTLRLQRRLLAIDLSVCENVVEGDNTITVSINAVDNADDCAFNDVGPDTDGDPLSNNPDGLTDNLNTFQSFRCKADGADGCARTTAPAIGDCDDECVWAYIYDPVDDEGEFFQYSFEEAVSGAPSRNRIFRGNAGDFNYDYEAANQPRIYILEEREYSLDDDGILFLRINRQGDDTRLRLVNQLDDFQVRIEHPNLANNPDDGNDDDFNPDLNPQASSPPSWEDWQAIENIQVSFITADPANSDLLGGNDPDDEDKRSLSSKFFPRNVLSNTN